MKKSINLLFSLCFLIVAFSGFKNPPAKTASKFGEHVITITNKTHYGLYHLYISPEHETHWGTDELDADHILQQGETKGVVIECGTWDVKIVDEKGQEHIFWHVELCKDEHFEFTFDDAHEHH
jgi:hypothetical protein